jgi:hypothetical protein
MSITLLALILDMVIVKISLPQAGATPALSTRSGSVVAADSNRALHKNKFARPQLRMRTEQDSSAYQKKGALR